MYNFSIVDIFIFLLSSGVQLITICNLTGSFWCNIDWVIVRPDDDIHRKSTVTDSLESDHYCTKSYFNISVSKPSTLYRTVRNIANIDRPSFIAVLSSVSEFSSVENANQFCDFLRTVLDKHAPTFSAEGYYSQLLSMV